MIERRIRALAVAAFACMAAACAGDPSMIQPSSVSSLAPTGPWIITGRVTERATPLAVAGAKVVVRVGAEAGPSATTDDAGFYSIAGVKSGHVTLAVKAENYIDRSESVDVVAERTTVDFQLMPLGED